MKKNLIEYLEKNFNNHSNKTAIIDGNTKITYKDFDTLTQKIATSILSKQCGNKNVLIMLERTSKLPISMIGVLRSGFTYVVIDVESPIERIEKIVKTVEPSLIITDEKNQTLASNFDIEILHYENSIETEIDKNKLEIVKQNTISETPCYILFTSGSTGVPKGTVITHKNIISYIKWFIKEFNIDSTNIFGSQTPLYFSMSVSDFFASMMTGATYALIPKVYFAFPIKLIQYLNEHKINIIYWVPSALNIVANFKLFQYEKPKFLTKVLFAGESMPTKQLNYWMDNLENVEFANLFGPTEATDIFLFYKVNRKFNNDENIPIGIPCENCQVYLIDDNGNEIKEKNKQGELFVKSSIVSNGYFNDEINSAKMFVQNPTHNYFRDIVYKTGDLAKLNEYGEFDYCGRKDFQIKHLGYRIELGEIEKNVMAIDGIFECCCLYDKASDTLSLFYQGKVKKEEMYAILRKKVPNYMFPTSIEKLKAMPHNKNGKIDRNILNTYNIEEINYGKTN